MGCVDLSFPQAKNSSLPVGFVVAHGPTNPNSKEEPELLDQFYDALSSVWDGTSKRTLVIGVGKVGSAVTSCVGNYSKGTRNENDQGLVDWAKTRISCC